MRITNQLFKSVVGDDEASEAADHHLIAQSFFMAFYTLRLSSGLSLVAAAIKCLDLLSNF